MSNKLKKRITCCLCDKTVPFTEDCQELFNKDVCPKCAGMVATIVNNMLKEHEAEMLSNKSSNEKTDKEDE